MKSQTPPSRRLYRELGTSKKTAGLGSRRDGRFHHLQEPDGIVDVLQGVAAADQVDGLVQGPRAEILALDGDPVTGRLRRGNWDRSPCPCSRVRRRPA